MQEDIIRTMPRRGFILSPAVKVQHTRTRDLHAQNQIVSGFGDSPEPTVTSDISFDEKYVSHSNSLAEEITKKSAEFASPAMIENTNKIDKNLTSVQSGQQPEKELTAKSRVKLEKVIYENGDTDFHSGNRLKDIILNTWMFTSIPVAIITLIVLTLSLTFDSHIGTLNFVPLTTINQCEYYINKDGENDQRAIDFLKKLNKSCPYGKFNYVTKYTDGGVVSIINCRKKMNYISGTTCISELITGVNYE